MSRTSTFLIVLSATLLLTACGRTNAPPPPQNQDRIVALSLSPLVARELVLALGSTTGITIYGLSANGDKRDLTDTVDWQVSPPDRLRIEAGRIEALDTGTARVIVRYGELETAFDIRIENTPLKALHLEPATARLYPGQTVRFRLIGEFDDGRSQDLSDSAQWSLAPPDKGATLDPTFPGQVVADDDPTVSGELTLQAEWNGRQASATLQRLAGRLQRLASEFTTLQLRVGQGIQPQIRAIFKVGDTLQAVPVTVEWSSENTAILAVDDQRLIALAPGETRVHARYGGQQLTLVVQVSDVPIEAVEIEAPAIELAVGQSLTLQLWARYQDGHREDVTNEAAWRVTPATRAMVGNGEEAGRLLALEAGAVEVQAVFAGQRSSLTLTLSEATLERLEISPAQGRLLVGNTMALQALGHYSDGGLRDLSDDVDWVVSDPNLAQITTLAPPKGRLTALASGTLIVTASHGGRTTSAEFTLHQAQVLTLNLQGIEGPVSTGSRFSLTALAQLEDGREEDLTTQVQWSSSDPTVLAHDPDHPGTFQALAPGEVRIGAIYANAQGERASTLMNIQVVEAPLEALELHDADGNRIDDLTLAAGTRLPLSLHGRYQDGRQQPATEASWHVADPQIAQVIHLDDTPWLLGLAQGQTTLQARVGSVVLEIGLQVTGATLKSIALIPTPLSLPLGGERRLRAIGAFSDDSLQDLSEQVVWESNDPTIARISNGNGEQGRVFGEGVGQTTLYARFGGITGETTVTVSDDPQALAGLSLTLSPNVILDDPITFPDSSEIRDQTTIEVRLFALGEGAQVPDGTPVTLTLTYPDGDEDTHQLQSAGGTVTLPLTSPGGLTTSDAPITAIRIQARVAADGITFQRQALLWVVKGLSATLTHRLYRQELDEGTRLLLLSVNLSNRPLEVRRLGLFRTPDQALDLSELRNDLQSWIFQPDEPDPQGGIERLQDQPLGENGAGLSLGEGQGVFSATPPRNDLGDGRFLLLHTFYDPALQSYFVAPLTSFTLDSAQ